MKFKQSHFLISAAKEPYKAWAAAHNSA